MGIETALIASSALGAGASIYGASQAGRTPAARNYLGEMQTAISGQRQILPDVIAAENEAQPAYRQLQQNALMGQLGTLNSLYNAYTPIAAQQSVSQLQSMYPAYNLASQGALGAYQGAMLPGQANLLSSMTRQAQQSLDTGTALDDQAQNYAQQNARAAMAARGLTGNAAVQQEVLNMYQLGQQRQQLARQYAQSVYGMGQGTTNAALNTFGAPLLSNVMSSNQLMGTAGNMIGAQGPQFSRPESQYVAGMMGQQYNTEAQALNAQAQAWAGVGSGLMSMGGNLAKGMLSNPNYKF